MKRYILALLMLSTICSCVFTTSLVQAEQWKGSYVYETDNKYTLTFEGDVCRIGFGGNWITCKCSPETEGAMHVTGKHQFYNVDFLATMEKDSILVTGSIALKNAKGKTDPLSLLNLEKAVFTIKPPFDLSQIAGTKWGIYRKIKKDAPLPFDCTEMVFKDDGNGVIGDWFAGTRAFTYIVENNAVTLAFPKENMQAVATFEDGFLTLDFGEAAVSFLQR